MPVSPQDFKIFAENIDRTSEIGVRNAISRLYYSIYLEIDAIFPSLVRFESTGAHESFIESLRNPSLNDPHGTIKRRLAAVLDQAKVLRVIADYKINESLSSFQYDVMHRSIDKILPEVRAAAK